MFEQKKENYFDKILKTSNAYGMCILYNTDYNYILVLKYWDSASGKVCGDKYQYQDGNSKETFLKFKRFFFDSTFDINNLFIVKKGEIYKSIWKNSNP